MWGRVAREERPSPAERELLLFTESSWRVSYGGGMSVTAAIEILGRLGLDVVALLLMAGALYRRRASAPEMPLVFTSLNLGLFAAVAVIGDHHFSVGAGFGLFALLSLVRLRSRVFTLQDMAYTFTALVLGLVNGLNAAPVALVVGVDVVLLLALAVADESRGVPETRVMELTLDGAYLDPDQVRQEAALELPDRVVAVSIDAVDHVRGRTMISVLYEVAQPNGRLVMHDDYAKVPTDDD